MTGHAFSLFVCQAFSYANEVNWNTMLNVFKCKVNPVFCYLTTRQAKSTKQPLAEFFVFDLHEKEALSRTV